MERRIMEAVARADLFICEALRRLPVVLALCGVLLLAVLAARHFARADPPLIDYDKPGVDITSEGPVAYTERWYEWR